MSNNIQLYKNDLPDDLNLGNKIAVDGVFMGLNVSRDPLCLIQISSGNSDAHIIQFDRANYKAPNLVKILKYAQIFLTVLMYVYLFIRLFYDIGYCNTFCIEDKKKCDSECEYYDQYIFKKTVHFVSII